ncbi:hypothetical protein SUGI_1174160 [Cryptomeria japonica]|nr:hypothetical protein SUGI_1174160 [Cryptomeria japonica]
MNGFSWSNKGWFHKANHLVSEGNHPVSEGPRNWHPKSKTSNALLKRDIPHTDPFLAPLTDHGNFQKWNRRFKQETSKVKDNFEFWCRAQWGKDININILLNDFYMVEFMSNKERWKVKNRGPYILDGIEVHIIDWQPNFNPRTYVLLDSKVWIRLYNCPANYWHIDVNKDICKNLGTFVLEDDILEDKLWGSFLKICISKNQVKKIPDEVRIIGVGKF